jgi:hypothetical protein
VRISLCVEVVSLFSWSGGEKRRKTWCGQSRRVLGGVRV